MRVLTALTYYHPHWTGLSAYAKSIAEGLAARGHEVTVLTAQHDRALPRDEVVGGVRVVRVPSAGRLSRAPIVPGLPMVARRLVRAHDLVHLHTPAPEALLLAALARAAGRPSIITHQGDVVMPAGLRNRIVQGVIASTMGVAMRLATEVVTHSADYAAHSRFLAPHAARIRTIYPPCEIPEPDLAAVQAWRAELGLGDAPVVGFAGRFVEEKGFDFLAEAMPLVRARRPDVRFLFAGETNVAYERFFERCEPMLRASGEAVVNLGLILDRQRLADFYRMCDVVTVPSRSDCFARVALEALLCGTPLVTADIPGVREVVQVTGMGRLVRPGDPTALADGLLAALEADAEPRPSRAEVLGHFDAERSIGEYEALLVDATRQGTRRSQPRAQVASAPTGGDAARLAVLLRNEADMAARRRVPTLMSFLELRDEDTVLDAGCGMGVHLKVMGELRDLALIGVDADRDRLAWAARERVPAALAQTDLTRLPFADGAFDKVLMSEVLEHLADEQGALAEVYRVLRPGGVLAISVPNANYPFWWDPINKTLETAGAPPITNAGPITGQWSNHLRLYLPAELRGALCAAGFVVEAFEEQTHHAFPFNHLLVYSIGKPLIEHDLLPRRLRDSADRFRGEANRGNPLNPVNVAVGLLRTVDRRNDHPTGRERTFVSLVAKARKPAEPLER